MAATASTFTKLGIGSSSTVDKPLEFLSCTIGKQGNILDTGGIRGIIDHPVERLRNNAYQVGGGISLQPGADEMATLLEWILGGSPSGTTYPLGESLIAKYITADRVSDVPTWDGCYVQQARFASSQQGPLSLDLEIVGKGETIGAAGSYPSLTLLTQAPFLHSDLGTFTIGGSARVIRDIEVVIRNVLDVRWGNSLTATNIMLVDREIQVNAMIPWDTGYTSSYDIGATGAAVVATWTNGGVSLSMSFVKVCWPANPIPIQGKNELMLPIRGIAKKSSTTLPLVTTLDSTP